MPRICMRRPSKWHYQSLHLGFCLLWLAAITATVTCGTFASSHWRAGRLNSDVIKNTTADHGPVSCIMACHDHNNIESETCKGFNFNKLEKSCELLSSSICEENDTLQLNRNDTSWRYYEVLDLQEDNSIFLDKASCTQEGKCAANCARSLNGSCTNDDQCQVNVDYSYCTASSSASPGICSCIYNQSWAYNSTLCIHKTSFSGFTWTALYKRIVNEMCEVNITVNSNPDLYINLIDTNDHRPTMAYYQFRVGHTSNTTTTLKKNGDILETISSPGIINGNFQNFSLGWCNGTITFGHQGEDPLIFWNDSAPIQVRGIGFYAPSNPDKKANHLFIPHNIVDPYFPTTIATGAIRVNGLDWHTVKILPDCSVASNIEFVFEYKGPNPMQVLFAKLDDHSFKYQLAFGRASNNETAVYNKRLNQWFSTVSTPAIVSGAAFKSYWIKISGATVTAGVGNDPAPLVNYADAESTPEFTHVSVNSCCGNVGYFKVHSHRQFHEHPNGAYVVQGCN
ncbi:uncharacterized protein [Macrobrachium rosenbergii]|uniref:uncharacterized protein n=1 Tax=Macrobrachium rosenbergii TaxID=79674 RepID=UPI0034D395B3